jgi:hypothetical protein
MKILSRLELLDDCKDALVYAKRMLAKGKAEHPALRRAYLARAEIALAQASLNVRRIELYSEPAVDVEMYRRGQ